MKALVIGGSGFIGSHVADALSDTGHKVTVLDLRPSPYLRPDQKMVVGDVLERDVISRAFEEHEVVYHMGGIAHQDVGRDHPVETVEQNVLATVITLEAARRARVKRYVYASSIYVYSEEGSFYRCSKQAAELYIEEYQRLHGLDFTILRYGTVYGPRADEHNSVHRFLRQALLNRKITVHRKGGEIREYIHVRDAALSSVRVLAEEFRNQRVVLTGPYPMKFRDLLRMIREIVGEDVELEFRRLGDQPSEENVPGHYRITPYSFRPKVAVKMLNNPYVDMGQGLLECLEEIFGESNRTAEVGPLVHYAG